MLRGCSDILDTLPTPQVPVPRCSCVRQGGPKGCCARLTVAMSLRGQSQSGESASPDLK